MTVGERYQKKWQEAWDRQVPEAKGISFTDEAHRCMDAAVPGLWDAEVLELVWDGGYGDQSEPEEYERAGFTDTSGRHVDSDAIFREGKPVRIIVLPCSKKEK